MKNKLIAVLFFIFISAFCYASYVENFIVTAKILKTLSKKETNKILQKYENSRKYNVGIEIKIINSNATSESHIDKRFEKGKILKIVVSSSESKKLKELVKNKTVKLKYDYYSDSTPEGKIINQTSWTLLK